MTWLGLFTAVTLLAQVGLVALMACEMLGLSVIRNWGAFWGIQLGIWALLCLLGTIAVEATEEDSKR